MMDVIRVKCHTNIDDVDCSMIRTMACRPMIGDSVSVSSFNGPRTLVICNITHTMTEVSSGQEFQDKPMMMIVPELRIELSYNHTT